MSDKKKTFILDTNLDKKTSKLTNDEMGQLFRKILKYVKNEPMQFLSEKIEAIFEFIKYDIDENSRRYEERCIQNKENGKKGGAPKGNQNAKTRKQPKQPKTTETTKNNMMRHDQDHDHNHLEEKKDNRGMGEEEKKETFTEIETSADLFDTDDEEETSADLFQFIEEAFGRTLNSIEYELINTWEDNDLTRYAVKESILNGARGIRYVETVLSSWKTKGFKTVQDVQAYQTKRKQKKQQEEIKEKIPDWFDESKQIISPTESEKAELEELLNEFSND